MQKTIPVDNTIDIKNASPIVLSQVYAVLSELVWTQTVLGKAQRSVVNPFDSSGIEVGRDADLVDVSFINTNALNKLTELRNVLLINNNIGQFLESNKRITLSANLSVSIAALFDAALGMADAVITKLVHRDVEIDDDLDDTLLETGTNVAFLVSRSTGELDRLTLVWSRLKGINWLGKVSVGAYMVSGALASIRLSKVFDNASVEPLGKAMAATQMFLDTSGGLGVAAFTALATHRIRSAVTVGRIPLIGLFISILATALAPLSFYSVAKEVEYAKKLDHISDQLLAHNYSGYQELAQIYRSKAWVEGAFETTRMVLGIGGGCVSVLAMAGGVTFPVAFVIGLAVVASMGLLDARQQPVLEQIAQDAKERILKWEAENNTKNYFENGLDAYYSFLKSKFLEPLTEIQRAWSVEQVAAITQIKTDAQMRELAAITKLTEKLPSTNLYADIFKDRYINEQKIFLDSATGIINLPNKPDRCSQALLFTTPLMAPGSEVRARVKTGKNQFITQLSFTLASGWQINDGNADSVADFSNVVQRVKLPDGEIKNIPIKVNMGAGNDQIILNAGDMEVDGGEGDDVADYRRLSPKNAYIEVVSVGSDMSYNVKKSILKANAYEEISKTQQNKYGKRTEQIQYRDVELVTLSSQTAVDTLHSVESILGTWLNDIFFGGEHNERFYGFEGDDWFDGKEGHDMLDGGSGRDFLMGGKGNDWLNGGEGNDTYFFNRGDGQDFIVDVDPTPENQDKLILGSGLVKEDLWLIRKGYDLELNVIGSEDKIVFSGWYFNENHVIEKILVNQEVLTYSQVNLLVQAMAEFNPPVIGEVFKYPDQVLNTLSFYWHPNQ